MKSNFKRVAIVTGGARGMGREMTLGLIEKGIAVAVADMHSEGMAELQEIVAKRGGENLLLPVLSDLTEPDAADRLVQKTFQHFGQVDIVVNNAGIGQAVMWKDDWKKPVRVWEIEPHQWRTFFQINTDAHFLMVRAAVPLMIKQGWGRIVGVTTSLSSMLKRGVPYGPSKAAAEAFSTYLAKDLEGTGVTVNILVPGGLTNTNFVPEDAPFDPKTLIQPQVMVAPLQYLVSDESDKVTARRFIASRWDPVKPVDENLAVAGAPIGWPMTGSEAVRPARTDK